jgi:hypothetical protein
MYQRSKKCCQTSSKVNRSILYRLKVNLFAFLVLSVPSAFTYAAEINVYEVNSIIENKPLERSLSQIGLTKHTSHYAFIKAKMAYENGEYILAKRMLTPLAMGGDVNAQYLLGVLCDMDETQGELRLNKTKSFIWYHAAARQGHSDAQHNLALAYAHGEGVEVNLTRAIQWWERAAHNGNTDSQYNLGIMYALGSHGVEQNLYRAQVWWYHAATGGDAAAQYNLGALYSRENSPFYDGCLALQWLNESAQNGFTRAHDAIKNLGSNKQLMNRCNEISRYSP